MDAEAARERMVREQIEERGVRDPRVLEALRRVPRELFVPPEYADRACDDRPLPIGSGQTISQPYIVACMTEALALRGGEKVLEIGTGSGYQTAVLCTLGASVRSVERIPELADSARARLTDLGFAPGLRTGDGTVGWPEESPFDRILVTAGAPEMPISLLTQLREGGIMVVPVGGEREQELFVVRREEGFVKRTRICSCVFVKLVGREGW
ncbi:MAG: protein-L-isoaspartate(D-aspartate) O-methyltransferase [Planctomycetes bacterium]|nr:protein-L-isoaspartate(D-aspartate) O-methyltransferase [Planctomycetota bacterium]